MPAAWVPRPRLRLLSRTLPTRSSSSTSTKTRRWAKPWIFIRARPCSASRSTFTPATTSPPWAATSSSSPPAWPRKPGQTRIDLAQTNVNIIKQITPQIVRSCPDATYVIVANPVDILTYVFSKVSGIPQNRIIGSGTLLDTARLRARIAEYLSVSQKNVHAYVFGEHGETSFVPWSIAEVSTISLADYKELIKLDQGIMVDLDYDEIDNYMRSSGGKIIRRKGCTNYAIAVSVCGICECLQGGVNAVVTVSTMLSGEYGISDVCLSLPMLLGNGKVQGRITPRLTDEELEKLHHSADALKAVIAQIDLTMPETKA